MKQPMIVFCQLATAGDKTITDSQRSECDQCGSPVWVAPNTMASVKIAEESDVYTYFVCINCAPTVIQHYDVPPPMTVLGGVGTGLRTREELVDQLQSTGLDVE